MMTPASHSILVFRKIRMLSPTRTHHTHTLSLTHKHEYANLSCWLIFSRPVTNWWYAWKPSLCVCVSFS